MFKKFNMFALTLLILGQTILGPIGISTVAYADEPEVEEPDAQAAEASEEVVDKSELKILLDAEKTYDKNEYEESSYTAYVQTIEAGKTVDINELVTQDDVNKAVDTIDKAVKALKIKEPEEDADDEGTRTNAEVEVEDEGEDDSEENGSEDKKSEDKDSTAGEESEENDSDEVTGEEDATEENANEDEEASEEEDVTEDEEIRTFAANYDDMDENNIDTVTFSPTPDENGKTNVQNGDTASFRFDLKNLVGGHPYGPGSTLTLSLPEVFKNFQAGATTSVGDIHFDGQKVVFTFNEDVVGPGGIGSATEGIYFEFSATIDNGAEGLEKEIQIPGGDKIELNFTPKDGEPVQKKSNNVFQTNADSIEWEAIINTGLDASGTVDFVDELGEGHKFKQEDVTITELTMKADGSYDEGIPRTMAPVLSESNTKMTLALEGTTAYKITYKTYPEDPGNGGTIAYKNSATYDASNPATATAQIRYSKGIEKLVSKSPSGSDLTTDWEIVVNESKRELENITVTDTWTTTGGSPNAAQQLVGNVKVFEGSTDVTDRFNIDTTGIDGNQGFNVVFGDIDKKTYTIKYTTEPTSDTYIDINMTVKNDVTRSDDDEEYQDNKSVTYNKNTFTLVKSSPNIDYADKTIDWRIVANQSQQTLENPLFEDRYENANMTLQTGSLEVVVGSQTLSESDYQLDIKKDTDDKEIGFDIKLFGEITEQVTITYTTDYDISSYGANTNVYKNEVTVKSDNNVPDASDSAERTSNEKPEQRDNGKKDGKYNYETKRFEWEVVLNFNKFEFTNAIFEDEISNDPAQTIDPESIKIVEGTLNPDGEFQGGSSVTPNALNVNENTLRVELGAIKTPHKITYESYVTEDVIPETPGKLSVKNEATLKDGSNDNASWDKTVGVNYTDKLINKGGEQLKDSQNRNTAGIKWNFEFNYAQSHLENIVITDSVGTDNEGNPNQLYSEDSFKVYPVTIDGSSDSNSYGAATVASTPLDSSQYTLNVDVANGTFELKLEDGKNAYFVEYETVYLGESGKEVKNEVSVSYKSDAGNPAGGAYSFSNFQYAGGGNVIRVPFVVVKTDLATGKAMPGIKFTLYHKDSGVALMSGETDDDGVLDFGIDFSESDYYLVEENLPNDYEDPGNIEFTLHRDNVEVSGSYEGTQVVEVKNEPVNACTDFTITIEDLDETQAKITLIDENGNEYESEESNTGKFIFERDDLPAGDYTVKVSTDDDFEGTVTVDYNNCEEELIITPSCPTFVLTIFDEDENERTNTKVTIVNNETYKEYPGTTNGNGEVSFNKLPHGEYTVYEGEGTGGKELGTITADEDDCEDEIRPAPKCETFTIVIKDSEGEVRTNIEELTLKQGKEEVAKVTPTEDGKSIFESNKENLTDGVKPGMYDVYEGNQYLGEVELTYKENCGYEFIVNQAPTCPTFTLTVKDADGDLVEDGTAVTVKDSDDKEVATETTTDGKITFGDGTTTGGLEPGKYTVEVDGEEIGEFATNIDCEGEVQPDRTKVCPTFTINDLDKEPREAGVTVNVRDQADNQVASGTTDENGKIEVSTENLPAGTYKVYENKLYLGDVTVSYLVDCEAELDPEVPNAGSCPHFSLTVNDRSNNPRANVENITIKDADGNTISYEEEDEDEDGNIITVDSFTTNDDGEIHLPLAMKPGTYTAYENGNRINTFTVDTTCIATVKPRSSGGGGGGTPPPTTDTCDIFTVTVKENGEAVDANVDLTLKSGTTEVKGSTDANGEIVFDKEDLAEGTYKVYDKDDKEIGTVEVFYDEGKCQDEVNLVPADTCEIFTITVKESGETVEAGTALTLKDAAGKTVATGTTNADGKIIFEKEDLAAGTYTAYNEKGENVGSVKVAYNGTCEDEVDIVVDACDIFELTVVDTPNTTVEIKDENGNTIITGTTDANGKVTFDQPIAEGDYGVYIDGKKVGDLPVTDTCEGIVTPDYEEDPEDPEDPNKPGTPGEPDPEDPDKPGTPGGDKPGTPGGDKPGTPGGNKPGTPGGSYTPGGDGDKPGKPGTDYDSNASGGNKLPQTGEELFVYMIALGTILLGTGAFVLFRQRRKTQ